MITRVRLLLEPRGFGRASVSIIEAAKIEPTEIAQRLWRETRNNPMILND
jgi:hypothetical protein